MTTQTGTVKWFNEAKGCVFIAQDSGGADRFAHFRDIQGNGFKTLQENQRVEFEVKQGQKGLQAANIRPLEATSTPHPNAAPAAVFIWAGAFTWVRPRACCRRRSRPS